MDQSFSSKQLEQLQSIVGAAVEERFRVRTAAEVDKIAELAAEKAVSNMTSTAYRAVGKTVIEKLFWIIGVLAVGTYLWARSHGWLAELVGVAK